MLSGGAQPSLIVKVMAIYRRDYLSTASIYRCYSLAPFLSIAIKTKSDAHRRGISGRRYLSDARG